MGSHSPRRQFLTSGAALAGFVMGAIRSVRGQTAAPRHLPEMSSPTVSPPDSTRRYGKAPGPRSRHRRYGAHDSASGSGRDHTPSGLHFLMDHVAATRR